MNTYVVIVQSQYPLCNNDGSPLTPGLEYEVTESSMINEYINANLLSVVSVSSDTPSLTSLGEAPAETETKTSTKSKSRLTAPEQENL